MLVTTLYLQQQQAGVYIYHVAYWQGIGRMIS